MMEHTPKLAYLTEPEPGNYVLNVMTRESELFRFKINRAQLSGIIVAGVRALLDGSRQ